MPVVNEQPHKRVEGLDDYGMYLLLVHQGAGAPHGFLQAALTEVAEIQESLGSQEAEEDLLHMEQQLHQAVLAWPVTERGKITKESLVDSVLLWRQVAVHLRRLTRYSAVTHDLLGGLRALTSALTGITPRPGENERLEEQLTKRRRDNAPEAVDRAEGYRELMRNWYRHGTLRKIQGKAEEVTCTCVKEGRNCERMRTPQTKWEHVPFCQSRELWTECQSHSDCHNRRFTNGEQAPTEVRDTREKGKGMYCTADIKAGDLIGEYMGEVVTEAEWERRQRRGLEGYGMWLDEGIRIDARVYGSPARFINHSCARVNCEAQRWKVNGEWRIGIVAIRDIDVGEECVYDYREGTGVRVEETRTQGGIRDALWFHCQCGSERERDGDDCVHRHISKAEWEEKNKRPKLGRRARASEEGTSWKRSEGKQSAKGGKRKQVVREETSSGEDEPLIQVPRKGTEPHRARRVEGDVAPGPQQVKAVDRQERRPLAPAPFRVGRRDGGGGGTRR